MWAKQVKDSPVIGRYTFAASGSLAGYSVTMATGCFAGIGTVAGGVFSGIVWCADGALTCTIRNANGDRYFDSSVSGWNGVSVGVKSIAVSGSC
ncbi:hypothetical protein SDC9_170672 [bioreactor metagenome]|uniref:Uncharacterized protein n=1 Tax=bioreactor metagenome TaxID=1076179 RepID=A0A645GHC4_9ZZZZ